MGDRNSEFEAALTAEILASERMRVGVLATTLGVLLLIDQAGFVFFYDTVSRYMTHPAPLWIPTALIGPFLIYECGVLVLLHHISRPPTIGRLGNAIVETTLPGVILWAVNHYTEPATAFGTWPSMLYFVFIVASTLRLDFVLPAFTGLASAASYLTVAAFAIDLTRGAPDPILNPIYHVTKAIVMVAAGVVAGFVAMRLRSKFVTAMEHAAAREHVTNIFGQHVSPAVVERLLDRDADGSAGEAREICVMFLDIRNFTAQARERAPAEVVAYLNNIFAFMIDAVDRHGGFINKFLGDGFMAVFGAPLPDPDAARHAVAAARDILAEIDRRGLTNGAWPLRVGIGLHCGLAITGNVGSPRRKEFTAIGDTVNLAARLEQLTKETGARLLVSEAVAQTLDGEDRGTRLAPLSVKGYAEPIAVWRLD